MIKQVMPIFGELETEIIKKDNETTIKFIDKDEADIVVSTSNTEIPKEMLDMSSIALVIHLNENNEITFVEHGLGAFTTANKELALFLVSIVGKKIEF